MSDNGYANVRDVLLGSTTDKILDCDTICIFGK